jgi:hypothetical protein
MSFDPVSLVAGGAQALLGAGQAIFGAGKARRTQKDLENYANTFQPNQSIMDYYGKALQKYNVNPYNSTQYQTQQNNIGRNLATGIAATQSKRLGLSAIGGLVQGANDASAKSVAQAEEEQGQNLSRLGQAAGMKTNEEQKKFDMLYNLKAMKAGQAANTVNSGIRNIFGGLGTLGAGYKPKASTTAV